MKDLPGEATSATSGLTRYYVRGVRAGGKLDEGRHDRQGLGLSIAKKLVNMMGGPISARSKKGEGSTFTADLPLRLAGHIPAHPKADGGDASAHRDGGAHRILLVEDIEINRMLAETILDEAGFLIESVPDGCDAVDAASDLILMDIQMPVMNGYEATRAIRAID